MFKMSALALMHTMNHLQKLGTYVGLFRQPFLDLLCSVVLVSAY